MAVAFVVWILTLGIYIEKFITSLPKSDVLGTTRADLVRGNSVVHMSSFLEVSNVQIYGIPFLFVYVTDTPPYQIQLVIDTLPDFVPREIAISQLNVKDENGESTSLLADDKNIEAKLSKRDFGDISTFGANIPIPNALLSRNACTITVVGEIRSNEPNEAIEFKRSMTLMLERETYVYIGWMRLLYYDQF